MAHYDIHYAGQNVRQFVARPFVAISNMLVRFGAATSMAHAAERVALMSDCQLEARGVTRAEAIEQVFIQHNYS